MEVTAYIALQASLLVVFTIFISDRRKKPGMTPLISPGATKALKMSYLFPIGAYAYSLLTIVDVRPVDWAGFSVAVSGTFLVVKGRIDLGADHTWAGYYLRGNSRTTRGVYRWFAHPMYAGIILMIGSCGLVCVPRLPWYINVAALLSCAYVVGFLIFAARLEQRVLRRVDNQA
jgi:protein-S-isoprenylcysteine O-methyltransferase Ste14